jgi:hypothetical protein
MRDSNAWAGDLGMHLASHVVPNALVDLSGDACACSTTDGAQQASRMVYDAMRGACGSAHTMGTSRLGDAAGTPRGAHAAGEEYGSRRDADENDGPLTSQSTGRKPVWSFSRHDAAPSGAASPGRRALRERGRGWAASANAADTERTSEPSARSSISSRGSSRGVAWEAVAGEAEGEEESAAMRLLSEGPTPRGALDADACIDHRPLISLTVDEVVRLMHALGYGRYVLGVRFTGLDGRALSRSSVGGFGAIGVENTRLAKRLHRAVSRLDRGGVPAGMLAGSSVSIMWQALCGAFPPPVTPDEQFDKALSARKKKEAAALTPRALAAERAAERGQPTSARAGRAVRADDTADDLWSSLVMSGAVGMGGGMGGGIPLASPRDDGFLSERIEHARRMNERLLEEQRERQQAEDDAAELDALAPHPAPRHDSSALHSMV